MIVFPEMEPGGTSGVSDALGRMDEMFGGAWRGSMGDIAREMGTLRADNALLRSFIAGHARQKVWPQLSGTQSYLVHEGRHFFARMNMWMPNAQSAPDSYRKYLSVDVIHNHYFEFFTICLLGPGYASTFWRDEGHHPAREIGETVDLTSPSDHELSESAVWFVEKGTDYHSQHWPTDFSVTLNIIPRGEENDSTTQYVLDEDLRVDAIIATRPG